ncbi:MAG: T9SS type A sorting domain-containing protein [Ginsengibacter sp.]
MKKLYFVLLSALCSFTSYAQAYQVGKRTQNILDDQRNNRSISTDIYYPATSAGNNSPIALGSEKFPVIVFGHGFLIGTGSYQWLGDSLASNGYIVAFPNTEGSISPDHGAFGKDLSVVCSKIILFNDDATSPFFGRVLNRGAIGGHSMGGGASFLAAASGNINIKALFNFSAAETNPSAIGAATSVNVPSLIFSGSRDCIVPAATQLQMFNNIPAGICKAYVNITDALHCQFADNNFTCSAGQLFTGCNSSPINVTQVFQKTISLLVPFLNYHIKQVCDQGDIFENNFNNLSATSKILQCAPIPACGPLPVSLLYFNGKFDGKANELKWKTVSALNSKVFDLQKSSDGQNFEIISSIPVRTGNSGAQVYVATDIFPLSGANYYRLKIIDNDNSLSYSEIINIKSDPSKLYVSGIYPNPVKDVFQVKLNSLSRMQAQIDILEFSGKQIFSKLYSFDDGKNIINIDASTLKSGVFMLLLKSKVGEILGTYKLIKL